MATWTDLGQSAAIAAHPTVVGRKIKRICPYNGIVVLGTGDIAPSPGYPVPIVSWDGSTYVTNVPIFWNNMVAQIRVIDNVLYAIGEDAQNNPQNQSNQGPDYVRFDGTTWTVVDKTPPFALHLWDMVKWNSAYWLAGVKGSAAFLYKSVDAHVTWTEPFAVNPLSNDIARFYFVVALSSGLFVQRFSFYTAGSDATSWKTTTGLPGSWTVGPDMLNGYRWAGGWNAVTLPNDVALIGSTQVPTAEQVLIRFTGTATTTPLGNVNNVYDWFMASDGLCYVLRTDRRIQTTADGITFTTILSDAPANARCLCAVGGAVYVGTEDSHLWRWSTGVTLVTIDLPALSLSVTGHVPTILIVDPPTGTNPVVTSPPRIVAQGDTVLATGEPVVGLPRNVTRGSDRVVSGG